MIEKNDLTTTHLAELRDVLGKKNIKTEVESPFDFIRIATNGLDANIMFLNLPYTDGLNLIKSLTETYQLRFSKYRNFFF